MLQITPARKKVISPVRRLAQKTIGGEADRSALEAAEKRHHVLSVSSVARRSCTDTSVGTLQTRRLCG